MKTKKEHPKEPISSDINDLCEQAGCSEKERVSHAWKWEMKRWHSHPSQEFLSWWNPTHVDPISGASVGGHPDARRRWARKDPGRWVHRWYGVMDIDAWNTYGYLGEFEEWQRAGSPEKEPFISLSASLERQKQFWSELKPIIERIGKPFPSVEMPDEMSPL